MAAGAAIWGLGFAAASAMQQVLWLTRFAPEEFGEGFVEASPQFD
jgi:hypothetical protein